MKSIASLEVGQIGEILARLKNEQIPAEVRTTLQESGLEESEIFVPDEHYDRGCDIAEAWMAENLEAQKKCSRVYCKKCGSRDYESKWEEQIGYVYRCKQCGEEFLW